MPTEKEMKEARKAIAYDLLQIIEAQPEQETYTAEEVKKLIKVYVSTANQDWGRKLGETWAKTWQKTGVYSSCLFYCPYSLPLYSIYYI